MWQEKACPKALKKDIQNQIRDRRIGTGAMTSHDKEVSKYLGNVVADLQFIWHCLMYDGIYRQKLYSWTQPSGHFVPLIDGIKKTSRNIRGKYVVSHGCKLEPGPRERKTAQHRSNFKALLLSLHCLAAAPPMPALSVWYSCWLDSAHTELSSIAAVSQLPCKPVHRAPHRTQIRAPELRCISLACPLLLSPSSRRTRCASIAPARLALIYIWLDRACAAQLQLEGGPVDTAQCAGLSSAICTILPAPVSSARRPAEPSAARHLSLCSAAPHMVAPLLCCLRRFDELPLHAASDTGAPSGAVFAVQPMLACGMHSDGGFAR
ncbi:hypothetical protein B0H13DRAFT_1915137 [Mycena leptocephala]|nr:hypothetical protein B0H13DRAFT_1915137 [Mycena leptocephala]